VVILCVGDSHTAVWKPAESGLPQPTGNFVNMHDLDRIHQVINLGQGGLNSSQVVQLTMDYLARAERVRILSIFAPASTKRTTLPGPVFLPRKYGIPISSAIALLTGP
jgi:hypothetical protein